MATPLVMLLIVALSIGAVITAISYAEKKSYEKEARDNPLPYATPGDMITGQMSYKDRGGVRVMSEMDRFIFQDNVDKHRISVINYRHYNIIFADKGFHPSVWDIREGNALFVEKEFYHEATERKIKEKGCALVMVKTQMRNPDIYLARRIWSLMRLNLTDRESAKKDILDEVNRIMERKRYINDIKALPDYNHLSASMDFDMEFERFMRYMEGKDILKDVRICIATGCTNETVDRWRLYWTGDLAGRVYAIYDLNRKQKTN